jgi:hypothetical protein
MTREQACKLLEVAPAADLATIRAQYRILASRFHPDRFHTADERSAATEHFQEIAEAFALLRSEARERRRRAPGATPRAASPMRATAWSQTTSTTGARTPIWWDRVDTQAPTAGSASRDAAKARLDLSGWGANAGDRAGIVFLFPLLLPSIVARMFSHALIAAFEDGLGLPESLANFFGLLAGHMVPGYLGLELGRALIPTPGQRGFDAILYGLWWILSGGLAFLLDRVA